MASVTKRTTKTGQVFYQVQIRKADLPAVSKSFKTKREAEEFATLSEAKILQGQVVNPTKASKAKITEIISWYLKNPDPDKSALTKKRQNRLKQLQRDFNQFTLKSLNTQILTKWIQKRSEFNAPPTVFWLYQDLKNALKYYGQCHGYAVTVFDSVKCAQKSKRRDRLISEEEFQLLFDTIDEVMVTKQQELKDAITFARTTAMRIGEMLSFTWRDVDVERRTVYLSGTITKTSQGRTVPLATPAVEVLERMRKNGSKLSDRVFKAYNSPHHLSRQFKIVATKANLSDLNWHLLRHRATTDFYLKTNLTDSQIAEITGHKTMLMLRHYTHLRANDLVGKLW